MTTAPNPLFFPHHPDGCPTCGGTDWDEENDLPCADPSWCQASKIASNVFGFHVCNLKAGHDPPHRDGAVSWSDSGD